MKMKSYLLAMTISLGLATSAHAAISFSVYFATPQTDVTFQSVTNSSTLATAYTAANVAVAVVTDEEDGLVSNQIDTLSSATAFTSVVFDYNGGRNGPSATNITFVDGTTMETIDFSGITLGLTIGDKYSLIGATFVGAGVLQCGGGCPAPNANGFFAYSNGSVATIPSPVPEPAAWATMLTGLGFIGFAMRKHVRNAIVCN